MHLCRQVQLGCIENTHGVPIRLKIAIVWVQTKPHLLQISPTHTHMRTVFHSHTLNLILCDTFLSPFPSRSHALCSTVMSQAVSVCRQCSLIWRSDTQWGGRDRSDRTTHAGWDRSTRAVSHETVPQALKISLKSKSKAERTGSRQAVAIHEYADSQNRELRELHNTHGHWLRGLWGMNLIFRGCFPVLIHLCCY